MLNIEMMKRLLCFAIAMFIGTMAHSQSLKKYPIGNSGCTVYAFCVLDNFETSLSEDSSVVYTAECAKDDIHYGVILVKLSEKVATLDDAEASLTAYLDYLQSAFNITEAIPYGKGNILKGNENTRGIVAYWKDKESNNWKVKAWTDTQFIAVLYAYSAKQLPDTKLNVFLDGFRFSGM